MAIKFVQSPTLYLAGNGVIIGATSATLTSLTDIYGNILTQTDIGTIGYITFEPDTSNEEAASFTGVVANANGTYTLTGLKTNLAKDPYTQTSGLVKAHNGGTKVVLSNTAAFYFNNVKDYIDNAVILGGVPAGASTAGLVSEASQAQFDAGTATETIGGVPFDLVATPAVIRGKKYNDYAVDSVGTDTYAITVSPIITSYAAGQVFTWKAGTANTGAATLNVCGLGDKAIKKNVSDALATGDILANQIIEVVYDGTNMQLISPRVIDATTQISGVVPVTNLTSVNTTAGVGNPPASSSTQTITHNLGRTPKIIRIYGYGNGYNAASSSATTIPYNSSTGIYNSTGNRCINAVVIPSNSDYVPAYSTTNAIELNSKGSTSNSTGIINNVGATTFDIVWTCPGDISSGVYMWEAE